MVVLRLTEELTITRRGVASRMRLERFLLLDLKQAVVFFSVLSSAVMQISQFTEENEITPDLLVRIISEMLLVLWKPCTVFQSCVLPFLVTKFCSSQQSPRERNCCASRGRKCSRRKCDTILHRVASGRGMPEAIDDSCFFALANN